MIKTKKPNVFKRARVLAGFSQTELAELLGVTPGAISQWETGKTVPSNRKIRKVSEVLEIPVNQLLDEIEGKEAG